MEKKGILTDQSALKKKSVSDTSTSASYMIAELDATRDHRWDQFVARHPKATIYHHSSWIEVLKMTYGYEPLCLALMNEAGDILAGLPVFYINSWLTGRRFISLPFSHFCDPLVNTKYELNLLINKLKEKQENQQGSYFELRIFDSQLFSSESQLREKQLFKLHLLNLNNDIDALFKSFHKSCIRRNISKSEKSHLQIVEATCLDDVKHFYRLQLITRKKHGIPPQPFVFFKNLFNLLYPRKLLQLLLVKDRDQYIAGIVLLKFNNHVQYQYGASDDKYLSDHPNHLLLWRAIRMAHAEGYQWFDFGKSSIDNQGLIEFKQRWGTEEFDLTYYYYPEVHGVSSVQRNSMKYKIINKVCGKVPLVCTRVGSKLLYKHIG